MASPAAASAPLRLLIAGATSAIATEVARRYAGRGARLLLLARQPDALQALAADLRVRGAAEAETLLWDACETDASAATLDQAWGRFGGLDAVLVAHGTLPDQAMAQASTALTLAAFDTNARSVIAVLTELAPRFEAQKSGVIVVISSPAGERGRASNYVYGAAKAAVTQFAAGLEHRLHASGVRVLTVLPGFVDTPMTAEFKKGPLWASPAQVARDIERGLDRGRGKLYTPGFWRLILFVVVHLPRTLFLRSRL